MTLDPLSILKARRLALEAFVGDSYDYLDSHLEDHIQVQERKYFSWEARRITREVDGYTYEYQLPHMGGPGNSHTQYCSKAPEYGVRTVDLSSDNVKLRDPSSFALATEVMRNNSKLQRFIGDHKNFWRQYLSVANFEANPGGKTLLKIESGHALRGPLEDRNLRDRYSTVSATDQLEFFELGLSGRVLEASRSDDVTERGWVVNSDAAWDPARGGDEERLERFLDYLNILRDECNHLENLLCGLCGVTFTPTSETYAYLRAGQHFCSFCIEAAVDSECEFLYSEFDDTTLLEALEVGLDCQQKDTQVVVAEISERNPITEVRGELLRSNLIEKGPEDALSLLATLSARPRQSLTECLGVTIDEWAHRKSDGSTAGGIGADGHYCQSAGELQICNYLTNKGLNHSMHPYYRDLVEEDRVLVWRYRGDLLIENSVVEYFGLHNSEYIRKSKAKTGMGRGLGIEIIEVRPKDLKNLDLVFHKFLNRKEDSPFLF